MSSAFKFPPPPPPPPKASPSNSSQTPSSNAYANGPRGRGGFGRGHSRGRGFAPRGNFQARGGARNGHHQTGQGPLPALTKATALYGGVGSEVAPSVPRFGPSFPTSFAPKPTSLPPRPHQLGSPEPSSKKRKLNVNVPGSTHQERDNHVSSDDDVVSDEEAAYAQFGKKLQFEHRGQIISLDSGEALKQWMDIRRSKWPTSAKIEARKDLISKAKQRKAEELQHSLRERALESQRREQERKKQEDLRRRGTEAPQTKAAAVSLNGREEGAQISGMGSQPSIAKEEVKLLKMRKKLERAEEKIKRAKQEMHSAQQAQAIETQQPAKESEAASIPSTAPGYFGEGLDDEQHEKTSADDNVAGYISDAASDDESDSDMDSSQSSTGDSDSSDEPQEASSRVENVAQVQPEVQTFQPPPGEDRRRACTYFLRGTCRKGRLCGFRHERPEREARNDRQARGTSTTARKTLYQRLKEQEQVAEDALILNAIKYLGQQGMFSRA